MHITDVSLYNFQSHKETHVSFIDGVNGLVGTSDAGKSTVLRAIQWCLTNHFSGTNFIRVGAKETLVSVTLSTGYRIERQRGKSASNNFYRLYKDDVLIDEYTGFGLGVPPEIREAHQMDLGRGVSLNFHHQLETAFLLANTPSQRADAIGNLDELARVDRAQTELNDELRLRSKELKALDNAIIADEKEIRAIQRSLDLNGAKKRTLLALIESITHETETVARLSTMHEELEHTLASITERTRIFESCKQAAAGFSSTFRPEDVNRLYHLYLATEKTLARFAELEDEVDFQCDGLLERQQFIDASFTVTKRLERLTEQIDASEGRTRVLDDILTDEAARVAAHDFEALDVNLSEYNALYERHKRLVAIEPNERRLIEDIKRYQEEAQAQMDEMLTMLTDAKQCFTCGQSTEHLTHECVEQTI